MTHINKTEFRIYQRTRRLLNRLWTVEDFMHFAQIGKNKAYEIINSGDINYIRTHGDTGHIRFTRDHINDWLKLREELNGR